MALCDLCLSGIILKRQILDGYCWQRQFKACFVKMVQVIPTGCPVWKLVSKKPIKCTLFFSRRKRRTVGSLSSVKVLHSQLHAGSDSGRASQRFPQRLAPAHAASFWLQLRLSQILMTPTVPDS